MIWDPGVDKSQSQSFDNKLLKLTILYPYFKNCPEDRWTNINLSPYKHVIPPPPKTVLDLPLSTPAGKL